MFVGFGGTKPRVRRSGFVASSRIPAPRAQLRVSKLDKFTATAALVIFAS